jgi:DNA-directed RNA polymerase specialized sigma24 family protein
LADIDDAYAAFFRAEYRSVLRTAFLIVRDPQRAEDIAQDAFVQLYQHWGKVSRYERPEAWVRRVAIRIAVRDVKRARVREALEPKFPTPLTLGRPDLTIIDAVKRLPPMQRAAIALFYLEDRPVAEIADLLGISVSTCTVHLTRGRRRLADLLGSDLDDAPTTTPLEGTWRSVLFARDLERRGFSAKQIHLLQVHDRWSSRQVNEIRIDGDGWMLWQGMDGGAPAPTGDFGQISVTDSRIRLDEDTSFLVFRYRLQRDELRMDLVRSTCDVDPVEPIPNFMYASVFGQPYRRKG